MVRLLSVVVAIVTFISTDVVAQTCVGGMAGSFTCDKIDLISNMGLAALGSNNNANDLWGWTDPITGIEYAIVGTNIGTAFVDISAPATPVRIGWLPATNGTSSLWRDIKVYKDHAYVVSEASDHDLQVFDMTRLRGASPNTQFAPDATFDNFGDAHNIFINEQSGFAYIIGQNGYPSCGTGFLMLDIRIPEIRPTPVASMVTDTVTTSNVSSTTDQTSPIREEKFVSEAMKTRLR